MEIEKSIIPSLGRTVKYLDFYVEDRMHQAGIPLTKLQFVFLRVISMNNAQRQNDLAELLARDKTTFTRNINTLEKKGLVSRGVSENDKRVKLVSITALGTQLLKQAYPIIKSIIDEVEGEITQEEKEQFKKTLTKIRTKLISLRESNSQ